MPENASHWSEQFLISLINAFTAHVCVLDDTGTIVAVNEAWRKFALQNPPVPVDVNEGANYLAVCDAATGPSSEGAAEFAAGIRSVLEGERDSFSMEYPCHSHDQKRWFAGKLSRFVIGTRPHVVVAHENISSTMLLQESLKEKKLMQRVFLDANGEPALLAAADGTVPSSVTSKVPLHDREGDVIGMLGTCEDISERTKADEALRESEELFRAFMDNSPGIAWMKDAQGRHVYLSKTYERRFGVSFEDWRGKTDFELWPSGIAEQFRRNDLAVLTGGKAIEVMEETPNPDGSRCHWWNFKFPFKDKSGEWYVGGIGVDVTEWKRAEEALMQSKAQLQAIIDTVPSLISYVDRDMHYRWHNRTYQEWFKLPVEGVAGRHMRAVLGEDAFRRVRPRLLEALAGEMVEYDDYLPYRTGGGRWVHGVYMPHRDTGGDVDGIVIFVSDITARKRDEEALRESEERFRVALENSPIVVFSQDRDLRYTWVHNPALGFTRESMLGRTDAELLPPEGAEVLTGLKQRALQEGKVLRAEVNFEVNGEPVSYDITIEPTRDEAGMVAGVTCAAMDITERKRAEEALRKAVRSFELLSGTARRLLETESLQEAIHDLCREVMSYLRCDVFFNFLVDKSNGRLRLNACAGIPDETSREIEWLDYGEAVCGCVARDSEGIVCENIPDTPDPRTDFVKSVGIKAYACHPLFCHGTVAGTLSFGTRSRGMFAEDERALIKSVADLVSIAMERVRTRETLQDLVQERTAELEMEMADRMLAQVALRQSEERYRSLAAHLQSMREEERARIAREVHDELGQVLAGMNFDVSALAMKYHDHKQVIERTESISKQIAAAIQTVKRICTELRPSILDHFGISEAIKWQVEEFQRRSGIACSVSVRPEMIILDSDLSTVVFRIFQEALTNIARHADATEISVIFRKERGMIVLKVRDNGRGIGEEHISGSGVSFGLMGIKERAEHAGGHVVVKRNRAGGTTVVLRIPLRDRFRGSTVPAHT